jgi:DNA-binding LacI/PurR family transcriptional regulator
MTTIREIAKALGVSLSTVSAVINKRHYISPSMRARVEKALQDANYQPNKIARSLRLRESRTIGLIVPNLAAPFFSGLMRGTEDYLSSAGYQLIVADSREDWKRQEGYLASFAGRITDGIILSTCVASDQQIATIPGVVRDVPFVFVDRCPHDAKTICVLVDNEQAGFTATQHLIELGHRHIAIITGPLSLLNAAERFRGYKRALRTHGIPLDRRLVRTGETTEDSGYWHGSELLRQVNPPTAVLGCSLLATLGVLTAIRELAISCPQDVSLVGFDDFAWSSLLSPPLTMVRQPAIELGAAAGKAILKRLQAPNQDMVEKVVLPTQLIVRESTAAPNRGNQTQK